MFIILQKYTRNTPSEFSSWAQLSSASSERYNAPYKLSTLDRSFSRNSARALFKLSAFHLSAIHLCRCVEKLASSSGRVGQRETPTETACIWLKLFKCLKKNGNFEESVFLSEKVIAGVIN